MKHFILIVFIFSTCLKSNASIDSTIKINKVKKVVYERIDVGVLNELKSRLDKIKKSIKWVAM